MPTDPTARDRETARRIAGRCWYATSDDPHATCDTVGASDRCVQCAEADAIAAALAAARAAERDMPGELYSCPWCGILLSPCPARDQMRHLVACGDTRHAAAIRARGEGA